MQCNVHIDALIRMLTPLLTAVSPDAFLLPSVYIVHFLAFRLPSEWALKFVHERYPPGTGRVCWAPAGTVDKKKTVLKRGDARRASGFFTTCQQCRDLSLPRGLFCIKHWSSSLKFSYFRTYFLLCFSMFSQFASLQDSPNLLGRNSRHGHHHTITLREVLGGCWTLRQLD